MNRLDYIAENQGLKMEISRLVFVQGKLDDIGTRLAGEILDLKAELEQVKAERDAAIDDITKCCLTCRNNCFPSVGGCCIENNYYNWAWRGRSVEND